MRKHAAVAVETPAPSSPPELVQTIRVVAIDDIAESPTNPRKQFLDMDGLTESIRKRGVLQPVCVRTGPLGCPRPLELVFGARRLRAAKLAGLNEIPVIVQEMDDEEVVEAQLIENCQRKDVSPLDEADAFTALHDRHGKSVADIAARVGKSEAYVYQRMRLTDLPEVAREALEEGVLTVSVALAVSRIPDPKLREKAATLVAVPRKERDYDNDAGCVVEVEETMSAGRALALLKAQFSTSFKGCGFPTDDGDLVPKAGACSECPKRSRNAPMLFADMADEDRCGDPSCFARKREAAWERAKGAAEAKGQRVLSEKEIATVFHENGAKKYDAPYVLLDEEAGYDVDPKGRKWKALLGKSAPQPILGRAPDGRPIALVEKKAAVEALKKAGTLPKPSISSGGDAEWKKKQQRENKRRDAEYQASLDANAQVGRCVARSINTAFADIVVLRMLAFTALSNWKYEIPSWLRDRLGYLLKDEKKGSHNSHPVYQKFLTGCSAPECIALMIEATLNREINKYSPTNADVIAPWLEYASVDRKAILAHVLAERKAAEKAKAKRKGKAKPKGRVSGGTSFDPAELEDDDAGGDEEDPDA